MVAPKLPVISLFCIFVCLCGVFGSEYGEHYLDAGSFKECCNNVGFIDRENPQIYCYAGQEKHPLLMFETVILDINIPPESYKLYEGFTPEDVLTEFESHRSLWNYNPFSWKRKNVRLDPFNQTCIGIVSSRNYRVELNLIRVDYWRVVLFALGILLFLLGPRLSKNSFFYYVCGVTLGVGASFLILVYFISRLFPTKPLMYGFVVGGWAIGLYAFQLIMENLRTISVLYKDYVIGYFFSTSLLSFIICYRFGPVSDPRSVNIIKWILQGAALASIFFCSYFQEAVLGVDLLLLVIYNVPKSWLFSVIALMKKCRRNPKRKLLTEDEYHEEGARETAKALDELRGYCSSPDCNQWRVMTKLKNPIRFAKFVEGSSHLDDDEVLAYDVSSTKHNILSPEDYLTDDSD